MNKKQCILLIIVIIILVIIWFSDKNKKQKKNEGFKKIIPENYGINRFPLILYINLEHRKDRKKMILNQLEKVKTSKNKIHRINAVKEKIGGLGCMKSHILSLQTAIDKGVDYCIILEDDFTWKKNPEKTNEILENIYNKMIKNDYPICLLSCNGNFDKIKGNINKVKDCQTASGYIIRKDYMIKLKEFWENELDRFLKQKKPFGHDNFNDQTWKKLQKKDFWILSNPILGKQAPSYSDIENKNVNYGV